MLAGAEVRLVSSGRLDADSLVNLHEMLVEVHTTNNKRVFSEYVAGRDIFCSRH